MVRVAEFEELPQVNEIRRQVNALHCQGRPDVFREGKVCGFATELFTYLKENAKNKGYHKIELDMWEFNESGLKFYESVGFRTYRRYLEYDNE